MSFCPTLVTKDHHRKDGIWFRDKEPIDSVTKTEADDASRFSGVIYSSHSDHVRVSLEYIPKSRKIANLFFHQVGQIWVSGALPGATG